MSRPGQLCIKRHPKKRGGFDPVDLLPEEMNWSGCREVPIGLSEKHRGALRDVAGDLPFSHPPL